MPSLHIHRNALRGLYVILDTATPYAHPLADVMRQAASAGATLFQYRDKRDSAQQAYRQALTLRAMARECGVLFIVNDRCDLALAIEADGVHLGQDDLPLALARQVMGPEALIGVSTHTAAEVEEATMGGADYLGFGPIFATGTKPDHEPVVGLDGLRQIRRLTPLPLFAIGGITLDRAEAIAQAGADGVAVISALAKAPNPTDVVRTFNAAFR